MRLAFNFLSFFINFAEFNNMSFETFKHFRYEIALDQPIEMPKPAIDYYPQEQYSVQQYLHILCKVNIGSLGRIDDKWALGEDAPASVKLSTRPDITQIFDFALRKEILEEIPLEEHTENQKTRGFTPYRLSKVYWEKFDKYAQ